MSLLATSIFFDINLPNPTTWFYFSGLLAVALFFKFSRLLSMRNLDVLTLFLFVPGLLLLSRPTYLLTERSLTALSAEGFPDGEPDSETAKLKKKLKGKEFDTQEEFLSAVDEVLGEDARRHYQPLLVKHAVQSFWGYLWLMIASLYFLVRCLIDLTLLRRPALSSNLDFSGLVWLAGALFVSLVAVAVRQPGVPDTSESNSSTVGGPLSKGAEKALEAYAPPGVGDSSAKLWAERGLALLCHLSIVVGLVLIGWRHFGDLHAGMAAATFYLLLPYTFLFLPDSPAGVGHWSHAWPMALVVWVIFTYRRPMLAGALLGVATGVAFFLVVIVPAWVSFYPRRSAWRFLLSFVVFAGVGLAVLGVLAWLNGELPSSLQSGWTKFVWQPWKQPDPATPGFWQDIPSQSVARMPAAYRVPIFIASMVLVVMSAFWPSPKNLAHVLSLSAATLISIQFWYADRGGVYVLWFLPLLLLLAFRPNLTACQPPRPTGDDWVARLARALGNWLMRLVRRPLRAERVG
jgi:hypothetical protein